MKARVATWTWGLAVVTGGCQLPADLGLNGDAGPGAPSRDPGSETFEPVVLWANGLRGSCGGTDANMQAALRIDGNTQPLYGPGSPVFLPSGQQTLQLGSGLVGCRDDYASLQVNAQPNHVYLLTAWGDPTNFTEAAALVDITAELAASTSGAVLVNLSALLPSVEFSLGGESYGVFTPGYLVVPGPIRGPIRAAPEAEPPTVNAVGSSSHYSLVLYRDNADGTAAELSSPAGVPSPP